MTQSNSDKYNGSESEKQRQRNRFILNQKRRNITTTNLQRFKVGNEKMKVALRFSVVYSVLDSIRPIEEQEDTGMHVTTRTDTTYERPNRLEKKACNRGRLAT
jgi:hypothetical protein